MSSGPFSHDAAQMEESVDLREGAGKENEQTMANLSYEERKRRNWENLAAVEMKKHSIQDQGRSERMEEILWVTERV